MIHPAVCEVGRSPHISQSSLRVARGSLAWSPSRARWGSASVPESPTQRPGRTLAGTRVSGAHTSYSEASQSILGVTEGEFPSRGLHLSVQGRPPRPLGGISPLWGWKGPQGWAAGLGQVPSVPAYQDNGGFRSAAWKAGVGGGSPVSGANPGTRVRPRLQSERPVDYLAWGCWFGADSSVSRVLIAWLLECVCTRPGSSPDTAVHACRHPQLHEGLCQKIKTTMAAYQDAEAGGPRGPDGSGAGVGAMQGWGDPAS